jgi:hypothetical protein
MTAVGKHAGEPVEEVAGSPRPRLLGLALGVTATLVAWGYLVWEAIDFGGRARDGDGLGWLFLFLATVGATACLFMTLILVNKLLATLRGEAPARPSSGGGKRVAR